MPDNDPIYKPEKYIVVDRPVGGLVKMGNVAVVPSNALSDVLNFNFDTGALEKDAGCIQIGNQIDETSPPSIGTCFYGYQFGHNDRSKTILRVNGPYLWRLKTTTGSPPTEDPDPANWTWVGVVSGLDPATEADIIGEGVNLGTGIQWAQRLIYADGGDVRSMLDWSEYPDAPVIVPFGSPFEEGGAELPAGTIIGEHDTSADPTFEPGYKLTGRRYSFRYTYYDKTTGFETNRSAESNIYLTVAAGDDLALAVKIPKNPAWEEKWSTIRLFPSDGAIAPANPTAWLWEVDIEGIQNLDIYDHVAILTMADGDLGGGISEEAPTDNTIVPKARYIIRDESGNRIVAFGDGEAPNTYYWSKDTNLGAFPLENAQVLGDDWSDEIRGGFVLLGRIYLVKRNRGIYMLVPLEGEAGGYQHEKLTDDFGTISHHSIVVVHTRAFWMSTKGAVMFSGQSPTNISDRQVREMIMRFARSPKFSQCYGFHDRRANKNYISWIMQDPDTEIAYIMRYDLTYGSWHVGLYGDEANPQDESGTLMRCAWMVEDTNADDGEEGVFAVYTGDTTGRCFRLRTNIDGEEVYACNDMDYNAYAATPWFGNGFDELIPTRLYWEEERCPLGETDGAVQVVLQTRTNESVEAGKTYALYDESDVTDGGSQTRLLSMSLERLNVPCRRFRIIWRHSVKGGRPKILWYRIAVKEEGGIPRHRGI